MTDQTGGVIVGAVVTLESGPARRSVQTNRQGEYRFDPDSARDLYADRRCAWIPESGFVGGAAAGSGDDARFELKVGVSVSVEVTESSGLSTDLRRSLSSFTLKRKQIEALPDDPLLFMPRLLEMAGSTGARDDVAVYVNGFRDYKRVPPKGVIDTIRINLNPSLGGVLSAECQAD